MDDLDSEDASLGTESSVYCPHCGERVEIGLDPGGGPVQQYIEDCPVCCRPWQVYVVYDESGEVTVNLNVTD